MRADWQDVVDRAAGRVQAFAGSAQDALECVLETRALATRERYQREQGRPGFDVLEDVENHQEFERLIWYAPIYYWTDHTARLVEEASRTYPLRHEKAVAVEPLLAALKAGQPVAPPAYWPRLPAGIAVFERPCLWLHDRSGERVSVSALAWVCGRHVRAQTLILRIYGLVWWRGLGAVPIWVTSGGSAGIELDDPADDPRHTFMEEHDRFIAWLCTAAMFVEQEVVAVASEGASRALRRRQPPEAPVVPVCHVVRLRRVTQTDEPRPEGVSEVEWSCRWLVRGHWRRQWFPARGAHVPMWIHEHIKGPEDKPFRAPVETVHAVVR